MGCSLVCKKFLFYFNLRIGIFLCAFALLAWSLKAMFDDLMAICTLISFLLENVKADKINMSPDDVLVVVCSLVHISINVTNIVLTILLIIGISKESPKNLLLVRTFYKGVLGTCIADIIGIVYVVIAHSQNPKKNSKADLEKLMAQMGIAFGVIGLIAYFLIMARSYYILQKRKYSEHDHRENVQKSLQQRYVIERQNGNMFSLDLGIEPGNSVLEGECTYR